MCGIAGIILKQPAGFSLREKIVAMNRAMSHRGPDGEGFILAGEGKIVPCFDAAGKYSRQDLLYVPKINIANSDEGSSLAFGHRRLSIIDLTETGHQPMCDQSGKHWIVYNGEIYNYLELRAELKKLGHAFISESDTEVILAAYHEWGFDCVKRFNGMWGFGIYDSEKQLCFMSRDRFGVKPVYYIDSTVLFAFASEQKAFTKAGLLGANISQKALHNYLVNGLLENEPDNFFDGIKELWPGHNLIYDLKQKKVSTVKYFHLSDVVNSTNDGLSEKNLIEKIGHSLERSIALRLRSDVEIGACLSGGIDSSALACIISESQSHLFCFTSIFRNQPFNEEHFAGIVADKIGGKQVKVEPTLSGFTQEADALIYSQDVPIWDTSTYAQYKVMELAKINGIKVVLDGQGADELFAGYHHHFVAKWNNLISNGKLFQALKDIADSGKTIPAPFVFYLKEKLKQKYHFNRKHLSVFLNEGFLNAHQINIGPVYFNDVNLQLQDDIYNTRLKSFLKCEDRCGMWHSVESRTPFSDDVELIALLFSFHGNKKIKHGVSKYLLREAVKSKIPPEIYSRYDKNGFETPMQEWMKKLRPELLSEIKKADFDFVNYKRLDSCDPTNPIHNKILFKLFVLSRWKQVFKV